MIALIYEQHPRSQQQKADDIFTEDLKRGESTGIRKKTIRKNLPVKYSEQDGGCNHSVYGKADIYANSAI